MKSNPSCLVNNTQVILQKESVKFGSLVVSTDNRNLQGVSKFCNTQ